MRIGTSLSRMFLITGELCPIHVFWESRDGPTDKTSNRVGFRSKNQVDETDKSMTIYIYMLLEWNDETYSINNESELYQLEIPSFRYDEIRRPSLAFLNWNFIWPKFFFDLVLLTKRFFIKQIFFAQHIFYKNIFYWKIFTHNVLINIISN